MTIFGEESQGKIKYWQKKSKISITRFLEKNPSLFPIGSNFVGLYDGFKPMNAI